MGGPFSQDWQGLTLWVHPPYSLISEVCAKLRETPNFTGTVVVPEWPSQDWFGFLHDTCTSFELFPAEDGLFLLHGVHSQPAPPWNVLAFHFVDFSWTHVRLQFASSTDLAHSQAASSFDYTISSGRVDTSYNGQVSFLGENVKVWGFFLVFY